MEPSFKFSLLRPHNEYSRRNRNVILSTLVVWAVAVFGFQILLKVIEKPVPEESLIQFEQTWPEAKTLQAPAEVKQTCIKSLLLVSGKNTMKPEEKAVLRKAMSALIYSMTSDSVTSVLLKTAEAQKASFDAIADADEDEFAVLQKNIFQNKKDIVSMLSEPLGLSEGGIEEHLLPYTLLPNIPVMTEEDICAAESIMKLYCIHNQSVLTDTRFLGFPFHYFYTAEFLLILFVVLCYLYCIRIEKLQIKYGIVE